MRFHSLQSVQTANIYIYWHSATICYFIYANNLWNGFEHLSSRRDIRLKQTEFVIEHNDIVPFRFDVKEK